MHKVISILLLTLLPGCAVWEQLVERGPEIGHAGQTVVEIGTTATAFNPVIGVWVATVGGLAIAASKLLVLFKKKEND